MPKDSYFIYSIFHENYDEIKDIIQECKKERSHVSTLERLNSAAKRSRSKSTPAQSTSSLPESGSFSSINTGSTDGSEAELLNPEQHKKVKQSSWFSWPRRGKAAEEAKETPIEYQPFSGSGSMPPATIGARRSSSVSIPVASPIAPRPRSNSVSSGVSDASFSSANSGVSGSKPAGSFSYRRNSDSGNDSPGSSTSKRIHPTEDPQVGQTRLRKTGAFVVGQPFTQMTVKAKVHQVPTTAKKFCSIQ